VARSAQQGAKNAQDSFNKFVEGPNQQHDYRQVPIDESKKGFWDDFSSLADQQKPSSSIGTSAMGKGGSSRGPAKSKDEWEDW
jgi:ADP-ribosylation factor GTPase-activating protein 1